MVEAAARTALSQWAALVTGSTSGIGAATARALADDGVHVVLSGRDGDRGGSLVEEIRAAGASASFVAADLAGTYDDMRALATAAEAGAGGRIDIPVNNAGLYPVGASSGMLAHGRGWIVNIGSWMARVGFPALHRRAARRPDRPTTRIRRPPRPRRPTMSAGPTRSLQEGRLVSGPGGGRRWAVDRPLSTMRGGERSCRYADLLRDGTTEPVTTRAYRRAFHTVPTWRVIK